MLREADVIVVGAGMAGLKAASELVAAGRTVPKTCACTAPTSCHREMSVT